MLPGFVGRAFGRWSEPVGRLQGPPAMILRVLAIGLRLYAGYVFIQYGYDKLLGDNKQYAMDADFFRTVGVPFPELTQVLIGALELFGGVALILGLLTRVFAFLLAGDMLVAMLTFGNTPAELPLFICCALLVLTGGGFLSVDQVLDRLLAGRNPAAPLAAPPRPAAPGARK